MDLLYRREFNVSLGLHVTISVGEREVGHGAVVQPSTAPVLSHLLLWDEGCLRSSVSSQIG